MKGKHVVMLSSGQPSLNPRLVKEADALSDAGYQVTVIYAYWNNWGTLHDERLLTAKNWKAIRAGGDPQQKPLTYFVSRLIHKTCKFIQQKSGNFTRFTDLAVARSSYYLIKEAKKTKADLYIGHNLGALPAVIAAAKKHNAKCGFDTEDFHRNEVSDDTGSFNYKIAKYLEDKYLPLVDYITASSPLIAEKYSELYNRKVTPVLNVFPKTIIPIIINNNDSPLKLFWFSQTIGPNRGLETLIEAVGLLQTPIEMHLLGQPVDGYKLQLSQLAEMGRITNLKIFFYEPVEADKVFQFASKFDIGIASETNVCLNREISLTNKIFTYIQSGLAVAASNTLAQNELLQQYPQTGKIYTDARELSAILKRYDADRKLLFETKNEAFKIGQTQLNWEKEHEKILHVIETTLAHLPKK